MSGGVFFEDHRRLFHAAHRATRVPRPTPRLFIQIASHPGWGNERFMPQFLPLGALPNPRWFDVRLPTPSHQVELEYLGTAGFVVRGRGRTLVLDPYVSRLSLRALLRPLTPDEAALGRILPFADDVLVGHAHYDHVLDAPSLCRRTGARLIGSRAVNMVGRGFGLPEAQLLETSGDDDEIACGSWRVRGLPSRHGKVFAGRVLFPGDIAAPPRWPARIDALKHGLVLNWLLQTDGFSLVHVDSADFIRESLAGVRADVLCLCAAGRRYRPRYVEEAIACLKPRFVIPCHWDTMITPIGEPARLLPGIDLPGMLREIEQAGAQAVPLQLLQRAMF
jgi:L-ascorbate metabolism protein UlaG (beta-lactamase superfamily)